MFAQTADFIGRFGKEEATQLSQREEQTSDEVIARALEDATQTVQSYIATRYALPLAKPPDVLTRITCDIARWYLAKDEKADENSRAKTAFDTAIFWLKDLAAGKVQLDASLAVGVSKNQTPDIRGNSNVFRNANSLRQPKRFPHA